LEVVIEYSLLEVKQTAELLLRHIGKTKLILLFGEMGTGKTTLIKELCKALGVDELVSSPTFSLVNEYLSPSFGKIYHFDLYRLKSEQEALAFGLQEYLDSGQTCLIEWPEMAPTILNTVDSMSIHLHYLDPSTRRALLITHPRS
jgi:tRNA threonylcarbamoyladenosine biosynthesis protein TsaE